MFEADVFPKYAGVFAAIGLGHAGTIYPRVGQAGARRRCEQVSAFTAAMFGQGTSRSSGSLLQQNVFAAKNPKATSVYLAVQGFATAAAFFSELAVALSTTPY